MKPIEKATAKENKLNRRIMILKSGLTQIEIARRLSINADKQRITRQAVTNELRGVYRSERVRMGMCQILGIAPEIFWPEFYGMASPSTESTSSTPSTLSPQDGAIN